MRTVSERRAGFRYPNSELSLLRAKIEKEIRKLEREIDRGGPFYELDARKEALEWVLEEL